MIRLAFLTTDNREQHGRYELPEPYFGTAMEALLQGFAEVPDEVTVHVISCAKRSMIAPEKLAGNIHFHQPVIPKVGWGRAGFTGCGLAVRRVLATLRPDIVHAQGTERDCAVSMMMAPTGVKLLTIHGHMARIAEITGAKFPSYYWMARTLEAMAIRRADSVVSLTNYTDARVISTGARSTRVIPNAVDKAFFQIRNSPEPGLVLCVAGVHPWKRQVELMEALDLLPSHRRPRLVFLGAVAGSPYGEAFRKALETRRDWCLHAGEVDRAGLREWLARAALLVLPSIEDNCPMVALEAMAAGVPVTASAIGGIPDLVIPQKTGLLFDPRNPEEISSSVDRLLRDSSLSESCRRGAKERSSRYEPRAIAGEHLKLYREVGADHRIS